MKTYDPIAAAAAQAAYCEAQECPRFAPSNGWCPRCGRNIYEPYHFRERDAASGITVAEAGATLITGCPHCGATFID